MQRSGSVGDAARSVKIRLHSAVLPKAQVRAPPPCRGHGGHPSPHRRGGDGAARQRRAGADVAVGGGRARGRPAAHALPPLPDRGRSVHGLLGHFAAEHPLPDLERWRAIADPDERLAVGLDELYRWYEQTEPMLTNLYRDRALVEAADVHMRRTDDYVEQAAGRWWRLAPPRGARGGAARRGLPDLALARPRRRCEPRAGGQAGERSGASCARPAPVAVAPPAARSRRAARRRRTRAGRRR